MGVVYRDLTGRNEVLFAYTQRWVPGRAFEAIGNLGCLTLATLVNENGYRGLCFSGITPKVVKLIEEHSDSLYAVCLYCDFDNRGAVASILSHFSDSPFYKLVGGPHTRHIGPEEFQDFHADAVICGEGEESVIAWLDAHRKRDNVWVALPEETTEKKKGEYSCLSSFSSYPFPDDSLVIGMRSGIFSVITARGCPHRCTFCFEGGNSKLLRARPMEEVLSEIRKRLENDPGLHYLFLADDTFTYDIRRIEAFCKGLSQIRKNRDVVWFCEGHASFFRRYPEALKMMVEAGMVRMQIGMESGDDRVLAMYDKRITAEDIRYTALLAWKAELPQLAGNYIIGGAMETEETALRTKSFVLSLTEEFPGLLDISTTFPIPLSGTRMMLEPAAYGVTWFDTSFVTSLEDVPVNRTDAMTADRICRARAEFLSELLKKMRELAAAGRVPRERIIRSIELFYRYGISDNWCGYIFRKDAWMMSYVKAVKEQGFLTLDQAWSRNASSVIPVPVQPLRDAGKLALSDQELTFLTSCDGRTLEQIRADMRVSEEELRKSAYGADRSFAAVYSEI